jgi:hypothetical protein
MNASSSTIQSKVSPVEAALVAAGLLAFIASFLNWFSQSVSVLGVTSVTAASDTGWQVGGEIIFVTLVMMYFALRVAASAADKFRHLSHYKVYAVVSALCAAIIFFRDGTYPSTDGYTNSIGIGSYISLLATIVATVACIVAATGRGTNRTPVTEIAG